MKAKCPTCGKHSTLPEADAGLLALCPACGTSYRAPEPEPEPDPLASVATAAANAASQRPSPERASESNLNWILLWIGAGIAALVALAAISWGLYDWNHTVKVQKLAEAARLRDRAELLIATGHLKEAEAQSDELETFAAGSPWP